MCQYIFYMLLILLTVIQTMLLLLSCCIWFMKLSTYQQHSCYQLGDLRYTNTDQVIWHWIEPKQKCFTSPFEIKYMWHLTKTLTPAASTDILQMTWHKTIYWVTSFDHARVRQWFPIINYLDVSTPCRRQR